MKIWQRPRTTRVYLHAPMSENMFTLWREGKFIFGEELPARTKGYYDLVSRGLWLASGDGDQLDFRSAEYTARADGIPIWVLENKIGAAELAVEAFGTPGVRSACCIRLTLKNGTASECNERFGFYLREDKEAVLAFEAPDVYRSYAPDIEVWKNIPSAWKVCPEGFVCGDYKLAVKGDIDFKFDTGRGYAYADVVLAAGEEACWELVFCDGNLAAPDYSEARAQTEGYWLGELSRIKNLPKSILDSDEQTSIVKSLTVQMLQCFARHIGTGNIVARQGGLQRQVWAYETMPVLESLDRLGDFDDYVDPIIDLYFNKFFTESGEVVVFGIPWAMATGNVLYSFAKHAMKKGADYYKRYSDKALQSVRWIAEMRRIAKASDGLEEGIFPPKQGCDDHLVFQSWTNTDPMNIIGLRALYEASREFGDPAAEEIGAELEGYLGAVRRIWNRIFKVDSDEVELPLSPIGDAEEVAKRFAFRMSGAYLACAIDPDPEDLEKHVRYLARRGNVHEGLYNRMPDKKRSDGSCVENLNDEGRCVVWYVSAHEFQFFNYFLRHGMTDRCAEILESNRRYAMTDERYMLERYKEDDPWFTPWMPNASANGRTVLMMLDMAGRDN